MKKCPHAVALGKRNKGVKKTMTPEYLALCRQKAVAMREKRKLKLALTNGSKK